MVDDGPWLYYKLTNEPKGSGELTSKQFVKQDVLYCTDLTLQTRDLRDSGFCILDSWVYSVDLTY